MTEVHKIQGYKLKTGDTGPALRVQLIDEEGNPENLSSFNGTLRVKKAQSDSLAIDSSVTIFDAERGIVEYDWQSGDTDTEGIYKAEVQTTDGTDVITYPNDHFFRVHIMENLE